MSLAKRATGQWEAIYRANAPELAEAMANASIGKGAKHSACPVHGSDSGLNDGFRLFPDWRETGGGICNSCGTFCSGVDLLKWLLDEDFKSVASRIEQIIGRDKDWKPDPEAEKTRERLRRIQEAAKKAGPLVSPYLAARGLETPPGLHEAILPYYVDGKRVADYTVMLGKFVSPSGKPVTWHFTYLHGNCKADLPDAKKIMPTLDAEDGGAIRLYAPGETLGIAEGIETAIAAKMLFNVPVWAAMNGNNLAKFKPPAIVKKLMIFGDCDFSHTGQACAHTLARRLYRRIDSREVILPPMGRDWNDVLLESIERKAA